MNNQKAVLIQYYNVEFYLFIQNEFDLVRVNYFIEYIKSSSITMKDIYKWAKAHKIVCTTRFKYRKDFPMIANLWNYYSYIRSRISNRVI